MTRYLLLFDNYGLEFVERPLWRENGSVFCICCWPPPGSLSPVLVPWDSWSSFTVSDVTLTFSSPPTTRRVTVEVFDPASTCLMTPSRYIASSRTAQKHRFQHLLHYCLLHSRYLAMAVSLAPQFFLWENMPQYYTPIYSKMVPSFQGFRFRFVFTYFRSLSWPVHHFLLDIIALINYVEKYKSWGSLLRRLLRPPSLHSSLVQIFSSAPFSQITFMVRDQFSHPYKTTDKITDLIFYF
jgi:hypothetical protein